MIVLYGSAPQHLAADLNSVSDQYTNSVSYTKYVPYTNSVIDRNSATDKKSAQNMYHAPILFVARNLSQTLTQNLTETEILHGTGTQQQT